MKKTITYLLFAGLFSCTSCIQPSTTTATDSSKGNAATDSSKHVTAPPDTANKWAYSDEVDKMTSKKAYFASIDANEKLDFPFPYDGGSTASLIIRNKNAVDEALLSVSKGQFISIGGGTVEVRFDDAQPISFTTTAPSDGRSNLVFIDEANKLIKKLKTAKKIIIQAEFYESGLKTMEFDVDGFIWAH